MLPTPVFRERKKRNILEYITIAISIIGIIIAGIAISQSYQATIESKQYYDNANKLAQEANNLTQTTLQLQNVTTNFQPYIIPYYVTATLNDIYTNAPLDNFGQVNDYGSLNVSLFVITPHAAVINFSDTAFNITVRKADSNDWLNGSNFFGSYATFLPWLPLKEAELGYNQFFNYWPEAFVQSGVTELNFTIPIDADVSLNSSFVGRAVASLGIVNANVTMFDLQTEKYVASYYFSENLLVNVNPNYG
ncbi:MAG TPA: hypothetical protein VMD05_05660 [Candidatus Nanoarchaeia archaeon]|nr:hypothetical protein [Candidatus Nanoarchaeia archaeon]